ncbi:hypothetical protein FF38_07732 [Lucilia cuprina]|uniref:Uncharacterized protein n=1 Tax=Lucilia cuprina TaxID=7375 RepID=A0A0L0BKT7_LUCCU|nr:hypothetical protein FF38_07732 [Lucilia cuprina]
MSDYDDDDDDDEEVKPPHCLRRAEFRYLSCPGYWRDPFGVQIQGKGVMPRQQIMPRQQLPHREVTVGLKAVIHSYQILQRWQVETLFCGLPVPVLSDYLLHWFDPMSNRSNKRRRMHLIITSLYARQTKDTAFQLNVVVGGGGKILPPAAGRLGLYLCYKMAIKLNQLI